MAIRNVISTLSADGTEVMGPGVLMYHYPGNDIMNGSLLTVESNHFCVLKSRGAILNVYETGQYPVETPQRPLIGSMQQAFMRDAATSFAALAFAGLAGRSFGSELLRSGGAGSRPGRHCCRQCRRLSDPRGSRHGGRGMGPRHRDQSARDVPHVSGGGAKHGGRQAPRQNHHDLLRRSR